MKNIISLLYQNYINNPGDLALFDTHKPYTYEEVFSLAIKKASLLRKMGLFKMPILVKVNRSAQTIIDFFAILLSNNYFVPVDENIPFNKLEKIILASNVRHYISYQDDDLLINRIGEDIDIPIIPYQEFEKDFDVNNYSYIVFTSGSTGEAKGVIKNHENIISFVDNFTKTFPFLKKERITNQTPFYFDASMKDIFLSLKLGASLFIPEKNTFSLPLETVKYLNENKITYIYWVPSILAMIAKTRTLNYLKPETLRYIYFVGEVFPVKYLNMWLNALPHIRYFNTYGSSEVMGICLYYEIKELIKEDYIPLGKPLINNNVILKNEEITVISKQVALGYLNSDNKAFFVNEEGNRELHTGDFAYYDTNNDIVFASRKDYQIKHLGYRIELQEIELTISKLDYIDMCAASYHQDSDRIMLYVSLNKEIENPNKQIISDAKKILQFYMVPNKVIVLDKLPLNNNDKIDRAKLARMNNEY